jgi:polyisoprenoid-binding protein YceI
MSTTTALPTGTWTYDPAHSSIGFSVKHSGIATFRGTFDDVTAEVRDGVLTGTAKTASVNVPVEQLKGHLLAPDFFDAEAHPEITFTATDLNVDGETLTARGKLTLKGVTKDIEATGTFNGPVEYLAGPERIAVALQTVVNRHDYGVSWNADLPGGGKAVGDDVTITVDLQFTAAA